MRHDGRGFREDHNPRAEREFHQSERSRHTQDRPAQDWQRRSGAAPDDDDSDPDTGFRDPEFDETEAERRYLRQGGGRFDEREYSRGYSLDQGRFQTGRGPIGDSDYLRQERSPGRLGHGSQGVGYDQRGAYGQGDYAARGVGRMAQRRFAPPGYERDRSDFGTRTQSGRQDWFGQDNHSGKGPKGYQRSDERIREDICECLTEHGQIDASDIEVKVEKCQVTLSGTVDSRQAKRLAEDIAEEIPGVRDVRNEIRVQSGGTDTFANTQPNDGSDQSSRQRQAK